LPFELHYAARAGKAEVVRQLLEDGADVHERTPDGRTPLIVGAFGGSVDVLRLLLAHGAEINGRDDVGNTPLIVAARNAWAASVRFLLDAGADPDLRNGAGETAFSIASHRRFTRIFEMLCGSDSALSPRIRELTLDLVDVSRTGAIPELQRMLDCRAPYPLRCGPLLQTPLKTAIEAGQTEVVRLLLEAETAPRHWYGRGNWAVEEAALAGHVEIVRLLYAAGAEICLWDAVEVGDAAFVAEVLDRGDYLWKDTALEGDLLHQPVSRGQLEIARLLIDAGAGVNAAHENRAAPLTRAVAHGHLPLITLLLERGADPDARNQPIRNDTGNGNSPLGCAVLLGRSDIVEALLTAGAAVNWSPSSEQLTPLAQAASAGHLEIVRMLLEAGADVNGSDVNGWTSLCIAAFKGHGEVVELLHLAGARPTVRYAAAVGDTALLAALLDQGCDRFLEEGENWNDPHWLAARAGHIPTVHLLLDRETDAHKKKLGGEFALRTAARNGHTELLRDLLARGVDPNAAPDLQTSVLAFAASKGYTDVVSVLQEAGAFVSVWDAIEADDDTLLNEALDRAVEFNELDAALLSAVDRGRPDLVRTLLVRGASANAVDDCGRTVLIRTLDPLEQEQIEDSQAEGDATEEKRAERRRQARAIIELLLDAGADVNMVTDYGETMLMAVVRLGEPQIVRLLLEHGADVNALSRYRQSVVALALESGGEEVVELLRGAGAVDRTVDDADWPAEDEDWPAEDEDSPAIEPEPLS